KKASWRMGNGVQKISREIFASILETILNKMKKKNQYCKNEFRCSGSVSFIADNVNISKCFKPQSSDTNEEKVQQQEKSSTVLSSKTVQKGSKVFPNSKWLFKSSENISFCPI